MQNIVLTYLLYRVSSRIYLLGFSNKTYKESVYKYNINIKLEAEEQSSINTCICVHAWLTLKPLIRIYSLVR